MLSILMAESELILAGNDDSSSSGGSSRRGDRLRHGPVNEGVTPNVGARDRVGRYELRERLGAGGMGIVYAAWDPELDRRVAIKFIRPGHAVSPELLARRLRREAQAMARVRHDNVVAVYDVGESADGRLFVAMEYVDGVSLRKWLRAKPRSVVEILAVFRAAGEGLAAAHVERLIHRDFKPDNVLVANDGKALVLDFGLASWATNPGSEPGETSGTSPTPPEALSGSPRPEPGPPSSSASFEDPNETSLTKPGAVLGTPNYMAPEQRRGQVIDARSDQFAFCVALWQALTGELPYGRSSSQALARARVGKLGKLQRKDVPAHIEQALRRGLAWHPEHRWPDMRALLDALAISRRRRWWWLALPAALAVGASVLLVERGSPTTPGCDEQSERAATVWNRSISDALAESFAGRGELARRSWPYLHTELDRWISNWAAVDVELCHRYDPGFVPEAHERQLLCLDRQLDHFAFAVDLLEGATADEIEHSFDLLARLPDPAACRETATEAARPGVDAKQAAELKASIKHAELEVALARFALADTSSAELFTSTQAPGFERLHVDATKLRSDLLLALERRDEAVDAAFSGLAAAERDGTASLRLLAFVNLAQIHINIQDLQGAKRWLAQATTMAAEQAFDLEIRRDLATTEAWVMAVEGHLDEALLAFDRAIALTDSSHESMEHGLLLISRAQLLGYLGKPKQALEQFEMGERELVEVLGPEYPDVLDLRNAKAQILVRLNEWKLARREMLAVADSLDELHGHPTPTSLVARARAAWLRDLLGDCAGARVEFEPLIPLAREQMPYPSPDLGDVLRKRAELCGHETAEAVELAREALALYRQAVGDQHVMVADARKLLARTHFEAGQLGPAREEVETALAIFAAVAPIGSEFVPETQALAMLIHHGLGEPGALDGLDALLVSLPKKHALTQRLEALR
jgi:serine/threonine protein kinase/tetratricopeptide (TPR) repeat protein